MLILLKFIEVVPVAGLEPTRRFCPAHLSKSTDYPTFMTLLTRAHVTRYRYPIMASIHREENKPNWFCHYYDPEGFRRKRSTGTENVKIARTISQQHRTRLTSADTLPRDVTQKA
jgi:hypothetical protein